MKTWKEEITCTCKNCGTEFRRVVFVSSNEEIEWAKEDSVCRECYGREQRAKREAAKEADFRALCENLGISELPELTGTAKQIAWAADIRRKMANLFFARLFSMKRGNPKVYRRVRPFAAWLVCHTEAHWFIEERNTLIEGKDPLAVCWKIYGEAYAEAEAVKKAEAEKQTEEPKEEPKTEKTEEASKAKYNRSEIMRRAWELYRDRKNHPFNDGVVYKGSLYWRGNAPFGYFLAQAWAEVKAQRKAA